MRRRRVVVHRRFRRWLIILCCVQYSSASVAQLEHDSFRLHETHELASLRCGRVAAVARAQQENGAAVGLLERRHLVAFEFFAECANVG